MVGTRESCRAMEKHKYWNEFEPTRHKFFKVMVENNFRTQMRIPRKFKRNFRVELPETIHLRGPSDLIWRVRLARTNEDVVLCSGWEKFVGDHNISYGDFLCFQYAGNATFSVQIFEPSCCEREGAHFPNKHTTSCSNGNCVLSKKDPVEIIDLMKMEEEGVEDTKLSRPRGKWISRPSRSPPGIRTQNATKNDIEGPPYGNQTSAKRKIKLGKYSKQFISNQRPVTKEEKEKAFLLAAHHRSPRPCFPVVMKATNVSVVFSLHIPQDWACRHVPAGTHLVELRVPPNRETWTVGLHRTKSRCRLTKGWFKFVWDNNLEEDDACVFEIPKGFRSDRNRGMFVLNVIIHRVVDEVVPLTQQFLKHN